MPMPSVFITQSPLPQVFAPRGLAAVPCAHGARSQISSSAVAISFSPGLTKVVHNRSSNSRVASTSIAKLEDRPQNVRMPQVRSCKGDAAADASTASASTPSAFTISRDLKQHLQTPLDLESKDDAECHPYSHLVVGKRWRTIQGENNWEGLLDPIDPALRGEIIRYGEFAQVCYDAFDHDTHSRYCGSCKYSKERLFHKLGLQNRGYDVTDYIYATSGKDHTVTSFFKFIDKVDSEEEELKDLWDPESNWMGYVAVTTDPEEIKRLGRRDIIVVWRGTVTKLEWMENLRDVLSPSSPDPRRKGQGVVDVKVSGGFAQVYTAFKEDSPYTKKSARQQVHEAITRLVKKYKNEELSITATGHSLGSALATLCAYDLAESGLNRPFDLPETFEPWADGRQVRHYSTTGNKDTKIVPVTLFSFAGPRVGNDAFRDRMEELGVKTLRLVNNSDKVTQVPGLMLNERLEFLEQQMKIVWRWLDSLPWTYAHTGVALHVDNYSSPHLKKTRDALSSHNLEGYLHLLNGYHGTGKPFSPAIERDLALVNKASNFLRTKYSIPPSWWQEENKGLVRTKQGRWIPRTRDPEDIPEFNLDDMERVLDDMERVLEA